MPSHAVAFAPGRANLIGEHTDYNQGLALPFAISEGVTVRASALENGRIEAIAVDIGERDSFLVDSPGRSRGWRAFVRGAAGELDRAGARLRGAELEISGTVPRGAGLSSSAALEVALVLAMLAVSGEPSRTGSSWPNCARGSRTNGWGRRPGLLDQIASLCGQNDCALRIDFRSLDVRLVALELGDFSLVTVDSGEKHAHAGSGYNERRAECAERVRRLGVDEPAGRHACDG